jgi:RNA polymerase sigma factor (sigma-70 family)
MSQSALILSAAGRVSPSAPTPAHLESPSVSEIPVVHLLEAAAAGDRLAWDALVERYSRLVWSVVRGFRLDAAASADVTQTVWLRLVEHCDRIREPEKLPGWLAATARNEAMRVARGQQRQMPSAFDFDVPDSIAPALDERLVDDEMRRAVLWAFGQLPPDSQDLLRLLCAHPPLDYQTISELVGRPVGSIGPTRQRILEKLRSLVQAHLGESQEGPTR